MIQAVYPMINWFYFICMEFELHLDNRISLAQFGKTPVISAVCCIVCWGVWGDRRNEQGIGSSHTTHINGGHRVDPAIEFRLVLNIHLQFCRIPNEWMSTGIIKPDRECLNTCPTVVGYKQYKGTASLLQISKCVAVRERLTETPSI